MTTPERYEVIIVGGGPAGSTLGFLLASAGISVALIEERTFPRHKLCGGMLTRRSRALYEKIYRRDMGPQIAARTDGLDFFLGNRKVSSLNNLGIEFVHRKAFDHYLIQAYLAAGGKLYQGSRVAPRNIHDHTVSLNSGERLHYNVLVGADGAWSQVRKTIAPDYRPSCFCLEQEFLSPDFRDGDPAAIYFNQVSNGYLWRFPNGEGSQIVGIGGEVRYQEEIKTSFARFAATYPDNTSAADLGGAFIPLGNYVPQPCSNELGLLLIGDAAGLANAITGEGLYYAAVSALFASDAIQDFLHRQQNLSAGYLRRVRRIQHHIDLQNRVNFFWRHAATRTLYFNTLGRFNAINRWVCERFIINTGADRLT